MASINGALLVPVDCYEVVEAFTDSGLALKLRDIVAFDSTCPKSSDVVSTSSRISLSSSSDLIISTSCS